jgi:hypothetical protein
MGGFPQMMGGQQSGFQQGMGGFPQMTGGQQSGFPQGMGGFQQGGQKPPTKPTQRKEKK